MNNETEIVYQPGENVAFRNIAGSAVIVNIENNTMIKLNDTGSSIWSMLGNYTVDQIAAKICVQFDVEKKEALADTLEFLLMMKERGLVYAGEKRE